MSLARTHKPARAVTCLLAAAYLAGLPAAAWRIEADQVTLENTLSNPTATSVTFREPFDQVPVVVSLATSRGGNASDLRVHNVTTSGFDIVQVEGPAWDGPHLDMTVSYIAAEPGRHGLPGGSEIIVATRETTAVQAAPSTGLPSAWETISFATPMAGTPAIIAEIQTMNSESANPPSTGSIPWLTSVVNAADPDGFDIALERSEVASGTVLSETVGYIALRVGASGSFLDIDDASVSWEARRSANVIDGWDDGCDSVGFASSSFAAPRVVASKNSRNGPDGGWLRQCSRNATSISLTVDEDRSGDAERSHGAERAGLLAFDRSFHARFAPDLSADKTVAVIEDPLNGTSDPYAITGARMRYTASISNTGNGRVDPGTLVFSDAIPDNVDLIVSDIAGAGSGPVAFSEPDGATGLGFSFAGLGDPGNSVAFSCDGGASFTCTPSPGPDGTDPGVTHTRRCLR